jgi:TRAP-type C4-dicarboxylate transport system permease small subunit
MHLIALALLAFVAGLGWTYIEPQLAQYVPASWQGNTWSKALVTGAFILLIVFIASFVLRLFPKKLHASV